MKGQVLVYILSNRIDTAAGRGNETGQVIPTNEGYKFLSNAGAEQVFIDNSSLVSSTW